MKHFTYILLFILSTAKSFGILTPTSVESIPMRDGKNLAADVYIPSGCTSCPAILVQTPYNRLNFRLGMPLGIGQDINSSPFIWVIVDWRGFYGSASALVSNPNRGQDGYDVIEWIKNQTWSNGKIGTWGPSALGGIQYQTMKEQHPNHTCAVPVVAHPQTHYEGYYYGGVLEKSRLAQLDALGYGLSPTVLANPYYNVAWSISENNTWYPSSIKIPTLQIGGWYDHNIDRMMDWYKDTRMLADASVQNQQWLLVGPWVHGGTGIAKVGTATQGELTYPNAELVNDSMALKFFKYYLLNQSNGWENTAKITYYELGKNTWNTSASTSIENTTSEILYFGNNGSLVDAGNIGSTSFTCDPRNPSPTLGGPTLSDNLDQGPYDQISLESRNDIITFSSNELIADVSVSGRIAITTYIQCDQPDADISIRLTDVYPDGRNMLINDGIKRMRFRNGYTVASESFMSPSNVYEVTVSLPFVNYTWKAGHKIKVYVGGNSATRWDVNLQNGGTMYAAGDTNTAVIQVHHSATYPSKILLPGSGLTLQKNSAGNANSFSVYPIPAQDKIYIEGENISAVEIYTIEGVCVSKEKNSEINCVNLPTGIYTVKVIKSDGSSGNQKISIIH